MASQHVCLGSFAPSQLPRICSAGAKRTENLAINKRFLNGEFHPSKATVEDNKDRMNSNSDRCKTIENIAIENKKKIISVQSNTETNSIDILKNAVQISERREKINDLQEEINANQSQVAEMISVRIKN